MQKTMLLCALWIGALGVTVAGQERLVDAARRGDVAAVRGLLDRGASVNDAQGDGMTALHWAAYNDDVESAKLLLTRGASVDAVTRNGKLTPLMVAAGMETRPSFRPFSRAARIHNCGLVMVRRCS